MRKLAAKGLSCILLFGFPVYADTPERGIGTHLRVLAQRCLATLLGASASPARPPVTLPISKLPIQRPLLGRETIAFNLGRELRFHYTRDILAPGTEARVFQTAENSAEVYRVPNADSNSPDLPQKFMTMKRILGDLMPDYLGRKEVSILYDIDASQLVQADVFTRIEPKFILPVLAHAEMSPELRRKVAENIRRVHELFKQEGFFPGDFGSQNYRVNPTTGEIRVMNDPGILRSVSNPGGLHESLYQETLRFWSHP